MTELHSGFNYLSFSWESKKNRFDTVLYTLLLELKQEGKSLNLYPLCYSPLKEKNTIF